jgi:hypothetical protein
MQSSINVVAKVERGMKSPFLASVAAALAALSLTLSRPCAWSQTTRTIKIVVPAPLGGAADIVARLLGEQIERARRLAVVLETARALARSSPSDRTTSNNSVPRRLDVEQNVRLSVQELVPAWRMAYHYRLDVYSPA